MKQGIAIVDYEKDDEVLAQADALDYMLIIVSGSYSLEILQYQEQVSSPDAGQQDDGPKLGEDVKTSRATSASEISARPTRMAIDVRTSDQGSAPADPEAPVAAESTAGVAHRGCALMI